MSRFPFLAKTGFASSQTARDVSQNSENKVFRLWTLFWDSFGYPLGSMLAPFWSPFGVVFDPLAPLGVSVGSCGVPLGLSRAPLRHFWCPLGFMGAMFANFNLFFSIIVTMVEPFWNSFYPLPHKVSKRFDFSAMISTLGLGTKIFRSKCNLGLGTRIFQSKFFVGAGNQNLPK